MSLVECLKRNKILRGALLLGMGSFILVGCQPEEELPPPPPPVDVVPVTYDEMKIKRDQFNKELYINAQEQQYKEIEKPFLESLIRRVTTRDEEIALAMDTELVRAMRYDEEYNNIPWLEQQKTYYQQELDGLEENFLETHPDASVAHKKAYNNIIIHLKDKLESRVTSLQSIITVLAKKGDNGYSVTKSGSEIKSFRNLISNSHDLVSVFQVYDEAIIRYFEIESEEDSLPPL